MHFIKVMSGFQSIS